jgi:hypothetical protein
MSRPRREFVRFLSAVILSATGAAVCGAATLGPSLWECNWCHQQYQGNSPPAFAKCPAKDMKQNHWWIKKG